MVDARPFSLVQRPAWVRHGVAALWALGTVAALIWVRPFRRVLAVWGIVLVALLIWWSTIRRSNEREWQPDVARLPSIDARGDQLIVHNVRNFDYRTETDYTPRHEDRTYQLSKLRGVDILLVCWGSPAVAHTIMSWQFEGAPPLAVSIETRKRKGQEYSAPEGFFKQYEIIYVVADERVVRVRTNYRGEQLYLYRLNAPVALARALLMDYVAAINALVDKPQFYNALTDNCTTSIRHHVTHINPNAPPFDWRMIVNGFGDRLFYERGNVDTSLPFAELRARSLINDKAIAADKDLAFSGRIREGLPDPRASTSWRSTQTSLLDAAPRIIGAILQAGEEIAQPMLRDRRLPCRPEPASARIVSARCPGTGRATSAAVGGSERGGKKVPFRSRGFHRSRQAAFAVPLTCHPPTPKATDAKTHHER